MGSRKIERAKYGPSMLEVLVGAVLSLLLGAVLAVAYLSVQPVQIGAPKPKEQPVGPVTFIRGTKDGERGKQWLRKKQLFAEESSVEVNEDELNAWITAGTMPEQPPAPEAKRPAGAGAKKAPHEAPPPAAAPPAAGGLIALGTPNFHIANGVFQIGSECELDLDALLIRRPLVLQASGRFVKSGGKFVFVPDQFYVGCCPIHKLPIVGGILLDRILANMKIPEDIASAWMKLTDVSVEGDTLRLTMP